MAVPGFGFLTVFNRYLFVRLGEMGAELPIKCKNITKYICLLRIFFLEMHKECIVRVWIALSTGWCEVDRQNHCVTSFVVTQYLIC